MTDNDAFARLKTRTRATVPARNSSLTETNNDQKTEISHSVLDEVSQDNSTQFSNNNEVTRRTLRIDSNLDEELERLCAKAKITRETFLEAAYLACTLDSDLMASVVDRAQQRYRHRKQAGEQRKFETMKGKYAGTSPDRTERE